MTHLRTKQQDIEITQLIGNLALLNSPDFIVLTLALAASCILVTTSDVLIPAQQASMIFMVSLLCSHALAHLWTNA